MTKIFSFVHCATTVDLKNINPVLRVKFESVFTANAAADKRSLSIFFYVWRCEFLLYDRNNSCLQCTHNKMQFFILEQTPHCSLSGATLIFFK
jgi:hypothetical protein